MSRLFVVIRARGPAWDDTRSMEEQVDWRAHAQFMNALQAEGFVQLGGPMEGTAEVLLIIRAGDAEQIGARLAQDPWTRKDLLRLVRVTPWTLRLGSLDAASRSS